MAQQHNNQPPAPPAPPPVRAPSASSHLLEGVAAVEVASGAMEADSERIAQKIRDRRASGAPATSVGGSGRYAPLPRKTSSG